MDLKNHRNNLIKHTAVALVALLLIIPLSCATASALTSAFLSGNSSAQQVMDGTPYDIKDPNWLTGSGDQNKDTFAYKLFAGLLMLGYQTEIKYMYGSMADFPLRTLNAFQTKNNLPVTNMVDSACLDEMDQQLVSREQQLAPIAQKFPLYDHMRPLHPNDISQDALAAIYALPIEALPAYLHMSAYETLQCINGQCVGFIQDSAGNDLGSSPSPIDPQSDYRFVGAYFSPVQWTFRLPSAAVNVDTVLHEYGHYLDGFPASKTKDPLLPNLWRIDTTGFYDISYDLASGTYCYVMRSSDPRDWISHYAAQFNGYGNCPAGSSVVFEDWAESFSKYVTAGRNFRTAAGQSAIMAQKYAWLKYNVFNGTEYDTDLPAEVTQSGCNDVYGTATDLPAYLRCNDGYIWDFTLPVLQTPSPDSKPDPFSFPPQDKVLPLSQQVSAPVSISGITVAAPVSINRGEYAINNGPFTALAGWVNNGDSVTVRQVASSGYGVTTTANLMVGGITGSFLVTTTNGLPGISGTPAATVVRNTHYSFIPTATNALVFTVANCPPWASFDSNTGELSGMPFTTGVWNNIIISAVNNHGSTPLPPFTITVLPPPPYIYGLPSPIAGLGLPYSFAPSYTTDCDSFTISGTLPPGLHFDPATGSINGTPTTLGIYGNLIVSGVNSNTTGSMPPFTITVVTAIGRFTPAAAMATERQMHATTLLPDGRVLAAGGFTSSVATATSELYNPVQGVWSAVPAMNSARAALGAALLPNGLVLVAGGYDENGNPLNSAELYNPVTNTWSQAAGMNEARADFTATLLQNGTLLVAGGIGASGTYLATAELYDPAHNSWTTAGTMTEERSNHSAVRLNDGSVLLIGGFGAGASVGTCERYNPVSHTWTATASMISNRFYPAAALLPNGTVLVSGGLDIDYGPLASSEIYNPTTDSWNPGASLHATRYQHTATTLPNGMILAAGGQGDSGTLPTAELYDPALGVWRVAGPMSAARTTHAAVALADGRILVSGGGDGNITVYTSSEVYALPRLTITRSGQGVVTPSQGAITWLGNSGSGLYPDDAIITLTAAPTGYYQFAGWGGVCSGTGPCQITMSSDRTVTATFTPAFLPGDVNGDNNITIVDALLTLRIALGLTTATAQQLLLADVAPLDASHKPMGNGVVDIADALVLLKRSVGLYSW